MRQKNHNIKKETKHFFFEKAIKQRQTTEQTNKPQTNREEIIVTMKKNIEQSAVTTSTDPSYPESTVSSVSG